MMRIQILLLPSVVVGDDVREPFGLIVDQCDTDAIDAAEWKRFAEECGACSIIITPETVDDVDRYAEAPEAEPAEGGVASPETPSAEVADNGLSIRLGESANVDPYKIAAELRYLLGGGRPPGRPTARQVIASTLRDDWFFAGWTGHVERLADAVLAALDEHRLDITRRSDVAPEADARQRAREWIDGFHAAPEDDRVNCVALLLDAADAAYECAADGHKRDPVGYTVVQTSADGSNSCFCVHGPDPVDTDIEDARHQLAYLTEGAQPDKRFVLCKLVLIEPREDAS